MFEWLKGKKKRGVGPDFSGIDSKEKAAALFKNGELEKLLLLPPEFGGLDVPLNVVYVPALAAELKTRTDKNIIFPLAQQGKVTRYRAIPEYQGKSFIPCSINIVASEPGSFTYKLAVWGKALNEQSSSA